MHSSISYKQHSISVVIPMKYLGGIVLSLTLFEINVFLPKCVRRVKDVIKRTDAERTVITAVLEEDSVREKEGEGDF